MVFRGSFRVVRANMCYCANVPNELFERCFNESATAVRIIVLGGGWWRSEACWSCGGGDASAVIKDRGAAHNIKDSGGGGYGVLERRLKGW